MSTTAKTTKSANAKAPVSPALRTLSLAEALDAMTDLDHRFGIIPAAAREHLARTTTQILAAAARIGIDNAADLLNHQGLLLAALTGVAQDDITTFHKSTLAEPLHTYRNPTVALVAAAAHAIGASTEPVYRNAVRLRARTHQIQRPLTDDEVLLARVHAAIESATNAGSQRANVYAMTDAGLVPGETTSVTLRDFDECSAPTDLLAPGNGHLKPRHLPLDGFAQAVLGRCTTSALAEGGSPVVPLTYTPRKNLPGSPAATASAQGVLDRMLAELGLTNSDVTASSITLWRVHTVWAQHGTEAAWQTSGRSTPEQMLAMLFRAPAPKNTNDASPVLETSFLS